MPIPRALSDIAAVLAQWGALRPAISAIYVFGSRLRGTHHDSSDLDIAVALDGLASASPLAAFIASKAQWSRELAAVLRMPIDLQLADEQASVKVWGYLQDGCAAVYRRPVPSA